jgi:hypothetical protein
VSTEALIVRDRIRSKIAAMPFFSTFHFSTNKALQIQPENIPFAGIYFIEKTDLPDGDANVAEVRFRETVRYGISVIVQNNDAEAAENKLDEAMAAINTLFKDPKFYNWEGLWKNGEVAIQAFLRGSETHQFGSVGAENEMPIAELRYDLTCDLGVIYYEPDVPDDLQSIHVKTQFPSGATQAEIDSTLQVVSEYIIWSVPNAADLVVYRPFLGVPTLTVH